MHEEQCTREETQFIKWLTEVETTLRESSIEYRVVERPSTAIRDLPHGSKEPFVRETSLATGDIDCVKETDTRGNLDKATCMRIGVRRGTEALYMIWWKSFDEKKVRTWGGDAFGLKLFESTGVLLSSGEEVTRGLLA